MPFGFLRLSLGEPFGERSGRSFFPPLPPREDLEEEKPLLLLLLLLVVLLGADGEDSALIGIGELGRLAAAGVASTSPSIVWS